MSVRKVDADTVVVKCALVYGNECRGCGCNAVAVGVKSAVRDRYSTCVLYCYSGACSVDGTFSDRDVVRSDGDACVLFVSSGISDRKTSNLYVATVYVYG